MQSVRRILSRDGDQVRGAHDQLHAQVGLSSNDRDLLIGREECKFVDVIVQFTEELRSGHFPDIIRLCRLGQPFQALPTTGSKDLGHGCGVHLAPSTRRSQSRCREFRGWIGDVDGIAVVHSRVNGDSPGELCLGGRLRVGYLLVVGIYGASTKTAYFAR